MGNVEMSKLKAVTKFDNHKTGSNCPFSYLPTDKDGKIVYDEIRGKLIEISDEKLEYIASNTDATVWSQPGQTSMVLLSTKPTGKKQPTSTAQHSHPSNLQFTPTRPETQKQDRRSNVIL